MIRHPGRRRGIAIALPSALALCVILGLLAFSCQTAVSGQRRVLDHVLARRTLLGAARSAFEEAGARLEARNADLPPLELASPADAPRDLAPLLDVPESIEPVLARRELERPGVQIGSVRLRTSGWLLITRDAAGGGIEVQEAGVLELSVVVALGAFSRLVTARRRMDAAPDSGRLRLHVSAVDTLLTVQSP